MINLQDIESKWKNEVFEDYKGGKILNERTMQAVLYKHLTKHPGVQMYIEPLMQINGPNKATAIPDAVICDMGIEIIAELKFVPHNYVKFEDDIDKFCAFSESMDRMQQLRLDPETGQYFPETRYISDQTQFAFFVIGHADAKANYPSEVRNYARFSSVRQRLSVFYGRVGGECGLEFGADLAES